MIPCPICSHPFPHPRGYDPHPSIPRLLDIKPKTVFNSCCECDRKIMSDEHIWISGDSKMCCRCYAKAKSLETKI